MRKEIEKHGHTPRTGNSPTYNSWRAMHRRCEEPSNLRFSRYGGAGVRVCRRWFSFLNFLSDMGERPTSTTLGRYGDIGHYTPSNCAWMTRSEQGKEVCKKNAIKTHCKHGHSLSTALDTKYKRCKLCHSESTKKARVTKALIKEAE